LKNPDAQKDLGEKFPGFSNRAVLKILGCPRNIQMFEKNSSLPNIFGSLEKSRFSKILYILEFLCCLIISSTFKRLKKVFISAQNFWAH
jgi:hypothetical protein